MWAATPFASAASWGEVRNDWPTTENLRGSAFLPDHLTDNLGAFLTASGQHHSERIDEGKPRSLGGERRQRFRVEADHEVRDGVAEALCDGVCFGVRLRLAFPILCERRLSQ